MSFKIGDEVSIYDIVFSDKPTRGVIVDTYPTSSTHNNEPIWTVQVNRTKSNHTFYQKHLKLLTKLEKAMR